MMKRFIVMAGLLMLCHFASAYRQKEVLVYSESMNKDIPHDFYVRPGQHNWKYWYNAVKYQFQFFNDRFKK